ncbi:MAG: cation-translocating P-type ATPase C-terminal domain-containing protein, partial [Anaerolineae bacterium]|nr:cation-translocating P-type ATPase C-terminal domain-containing protein [Anaerolineae bacterium]
ILNYLGLSLIAVISVSSALVGLYLFGHYYQMHNSAIAGRSYAFASFAVNSMIYIFAYRSLRRSIFHSGRLSQNKPLIAAVLGGLVLAMGAFVVPPIRNLLGIVPLSLSQWGGVFGIAFLLLVTVEVGKRLTNHRHKALVVQASRR